MKKIILATTMLAATAGFASADVSISGAGRMGLVQKNIDGNVETQFSSRLRIKFSASGTTDGGLSFGGAVRNDQDGVGNTANGNSTVFVSGAFGTLTFGDVNGGAGDNLVGQISGVGFTNLGDTNEIGFLPGDSTSVTAVRYDYTSGPLSVSLGASQTNANDFAHKASVAVKYDGGTYNVAVGYETVTGNHLLSAKVGATFGAATVQVKYVSSAKVLGCCGQKGKNQVGVSLDYAVSPSLTATAFFTDHAYGYIAKGLGATYDLGGGAKVVGGVINNGDDTLADLGMTLAF